MSFASTQTRFIGAVEDAWSLYSNQAKDYTIGLPVGFGASSTVYAAVYQSPGGPVPCALKVLDLDKLPPNSLELLKRETTLMSLSKHPNVLRVRGSWLAAHKLYIALRLMNKGSAADVLRYGWPGGMDEETVRCILKQALEGLNYLHINGFIHRDVKAANLLIDEDGTVLLGDLGVAADLTDEKRTSFSTGDSSDPSSLITARTPAHLTTTAARAVRPKVGKRKSFVGTPCWMSPELIQGQHYDSSSDIWSFGITALELTQGRPPRSRESPQNILLRTVQEDPPLLEREGGTYKYSKAFKEVVESCLVKDPSKRPTAAELLQTPFFKSAKKKNYLVGAILHDLPPLTSRQERRKQPSIISDFSVASWDFTRSAPGSPTTTHQRRQFSQGFADPGEEREHGSSPLGDGAKSYLRGGNRGGHSKNVSWAGSDHHSVDGHSYFHDSPSHSSHPTAAIPEEQLSTSPKTPSAMQIHNVEVQAVVAEAVAPTSDFSSSGDSSSPAASSPASSVPEIANTSTAPSRVSSPAPGARTVGSSSPKAKTGLVPTTQTPSNLWKKIKKSALPSASKESLENGPGMRATMGATLSRAMSSGHARAITSEPTPAPLLTETRRIKSGNMGMGSLLKRASTKNL